MSVDKLDPQWGAAGWAGIIIRASSEAAGSHAVAEVRSLVGVVQATRESLSGVAERRYTRYAVAEGSGVAEAVGASRYTL